MTVLAILRNPYKPLSWAGRFALRDVRRLFFAIVAMILLVKRSGAEIRKTQHGHTILFFPQGVYHFFAFSFWGLNYFLNNVCYFQNNGLPEWDCRFETEKLSMPQERLVQLKRQILAKELVTFKEEEVVALFDTLRPATREDLIGKSYRGHIVRSGCFLDVVDKHLVRPLMELGFSWGKRYRTQYIGDPLLCSWKDQVFFPLPIWGNVGMTSIQWRGQHQATMNYDHQPWQDFFRILDDNQESNGRVYLGVWTAREKTGGWFTLTLRPNIETL